MDGQGEGTTGKDEEAGVSRSRRISRQSTCVFGAAAAGIGILGLIGLAFDITVLQRFSPGYQAIAFSTAVILVVFGTILILSASHRLEGEAAALVRIIVAGIAVIEAIELPLNVMGSHFTSETWLIHIGDIIAGHPTNASSPGTLFLVILAGIGLFLLLGIPRNEQGKAPERDAAGVTGMIITLVSLTVIISYA